MHIIVGLGNPGEEYKETRHNTGRMALEHVRKTHDFSQWEMNKKLKALVSEGKIGKEKVMLVMPETFMNKSGQSVAPIVTSAKKAKDMLVVYDELDLPIGRMKISFNRSSGGHKGLESIIRAVKTEAFPRLRIGISGKTATGKIKKPSGDAAVGDFILGEFRDGEMSELKKVMKKAAEAIELVVTEGHDIAAGKVNAG